jgi:two-component system response regulator YesN
MSFIGYLNRVRIDRAGELLKSTHNKLYAIAESVGFSDESYFSRTFKRIKGVRPGEYRKMRV